MKQKLFLFGCSLCFTNFKQLMGSFYLGARQERLRCFHTDTDCMKHQAVFFFFSLSLSFHQSPHAKLDSQGTLHIASYHKTKAKP